MGYLVFRGTADTHDILTDISIGKVHWLRWATSDAFVCARAQMHAGGVYLSECKCASAYDRRMGTHLPLRHDDRDVDTCDQAVDIICSGSDISLARFQRRRADLGGMVVCSLRGDDSLSEDFYLLHSRWFHLLLI